jgi:hypothetical protein
LTSGDVLLNMPDASVLNLSGGNIVNILAPLANTTFSSGLLTGGLYVGSLNGAGQIDGGEFDGLSKLPIANHFPSPEPATLSLLAVGRLALLRRKRK